jgi:hypothetical protein
MSNNSLIYLLDTNVCIMYLKGRSQSKKSDRTTTSISETIHLTDSQHIKPLGKVDYLPENLPGKLNHLSPV